MSVDFSRTKKYPNKYNLTPDGIKELRILDWERLKKKTWPNIAMSATGEWWCIIIGCHPCDPMYDDEDECWIGFRREDDKIKCEFSCFSGMCTYDFETFYDPEVIENQYDINVHVNTIKWLNKMIDEGILGLPNG